MSYGRVERALERAGTTVAPPERTHRSGTTSVLPAAPTVMSSRVRINREPARRDVDEEKSDEDGEGDEAEEKSKVTDGGDLDEDEDLGGGGEDLGEEGDEVEDGDEDEGGNRDVDMEEAKNTPLSVDGKIFILEIFNFFKFLIFWF